MLLSEAAEQPPKPRSRLGSSEQLPQVAVELMAPLLDCRMEGTDRNVTSDQVAIATATEFVSLARHPKKAPALSWWGWGGFMARVLWVHLIWRLRRGIVPILTLPGVV